MRAEATSGDALGDSGDELMDGTAGGYAARRKKRRLAEKTGEAGSNGLGFLIAFSERVSTVATLKFIYFKLRHALQCYYVFLQRAWLVSRSFTLVLMLLQHNLRVRTV